MKKLLIPTITLLIILISTISAYAVTCTPGVLTWEGDSLYYGDASGAPVCSQWVKISNDWYYFGDSGKAYRGGKKQIGDKVYVFDAEGRMLSGPLDENLDPIGDTDEAEAMINCTYLLGGPDDGSMVLRWYKAEPAVFPEGYDDRSELWFYFNPSSGKKTVSSTKTIDGKSYAFDENGIMKSGWITNKNNQNVYLGGEGGGTQKTDGWVKTTLPGSDANSTKYWFYFVNGKPKTSTAAKIDGQYYLFGSKGNMLTGLYACKGKSISNVDAKSASAVSTSDAEALMNPDNYAGKCLYYFTSNGMLSGCEKEIKVGGQPRIFKFKDSGAGINGEDGGKLYINGMQIKAQYEKYEAFRGKDGKRYFVNSSGAVIRKGKTAGGGDDCYAVSKAGALGRFSDKTEAKEFAQSREEGDVDVEYVN